MKKIITQLLNSDDAKLEINQFTSLYRYTRTPFDVDTPTDTIAVSVNLDSGHVKLITNARALGAQGVIDMVLEIQRKAFDDCLTKLENQIKNGYCAGSVKEE